MTSSSDRRELEDAIGRPAAARWIAKARRARLADILLGLMFIAVIGIGALAVISLNASSDANSASRDARSAALIATANAQRLDVASDAFCHRLQVVRDGENTLDARVYLVLLQVRDGARKTIGSVPGAAGRAREYTALAEASKYRPPTDCLQAVEHPLTYKPPKPVPMSKVPVAKVRELAGLPPVQ